MKSMRSFVRLGANHSHSRSYGADLQRRMADEGAISCHRFGATDYQSANRAARTITKSGLTSLSSPACRQVQVVPHHQATLSN